MREDLIGAVEDVLLNTKSTLQQSEEAVDLLNHQELQALCSRHSIPQGSRSSDKLRGSLIHYSARLRVPTGLSKPQAGRQWQFWQVLECYNKKLFMREEILKSIAADARYGEAPSESILKRLGEHEQWLKDFEQGTCTTAFDIHI